MERERPYNLPVELARGTLNRLRHQAHEWQTMGMTLPDDFLAEAKTAAQFFAGAATNLDSDRGGPISTAIDQVVARRDRIVGQ